jgi:hypothetical protein
MKSINTVDEIYLSHPILVPCPAITGTNAKANGSGPWFPGMVAMLKCPEGTVPINGNLTITCTQKSEWDSKPPTCIGK